MSNVVDTLITKYVLDDTQYKQGAQGVVGSTNSMGASMSAGMSIVNAVTAAIGLAAAAVGAFGVAAVNKAAQFDSLVRSLEAVEGSSAKAAKRLKELRDLAKAPGIGFEEAVMGDALLRRSGISEGMSTRIMREMANQIAGSGGGRAEFERVMRAMMQISSKPFLQGDELLQLTEAGLPAHKMVRDAFGTSDTEELKRRGIGSAQVIEALVTSLEKTARVAGGAKNDFENLGAAFDYLQVQAGMAINRAFLPFVNHITGMLELMGEAGIADTVFGRVAESIQRVVDKMGKNGMEDAILNVGAIVAVAADNMDVFSGIIVGLMGTVRAAIQTIHNALGSLPGGKYLPTYAVTGTVLANFDNFDETIRGMKADMAIARIKRKGGTDDSSLELPPPPNSIESKIEENTRATASYTKQLADYTNQIFGGGDIGRKGISAVEVNSIKGRTAQGARGDKINRAAAVLGEIFNEGVMEGIMRAKQAGMI